MMRISKHSFAAACVLSYLMAFWVVSPAAAQNLIGLNFTTAGAAAPDPQNWTRISTPNGVLSNLPDETGASTSVGVSFGGLGPGDPNGFVYLGTATLAPDAVPQYSYDLSGMTGYGFRSNGEFFVEFDGLVPGALYEYWFVAYRGSTTIDQTVFVSKGDVLAAESFDQFITAGDNDGRFVINETVSSNMQQFNDLSQITSANSNGNIRFEWAFTAQTPVIGALAIRFVPEPTDLAGVAMAGLAVLGYRRRL